MEISPLRRLILEGESEQVAFGGNTDLEAIGQAVCAFLNTSGGALILGVESGGTILGVPSAGKQKNRIQEHLVGKISPKALWSIGVEDLNRHEVIVIDVPQGAEGPYLYEDRIFVREAARVRSAAAPDITALIQKRSAQAVRWEHMPALGFALSDLDEKEILRAAEEGSTRRLYPFREPRSSAAILEDLNFFRNGSILNGALALFGKDPGRRYPQLRVRLARFDDTGKLEDSRLLEGNVFVLIEQIQAFLRQYIPITSEFPEGSLQRSDSPAYPWRALREAIMNALAHREYGAFDGGVFLSVHRDRIEIWNSGGLPEGMTVRDLKEERISRLRNPNIAHVLWLRGLIEGFGTGSGLILMECARAGLPEPEWKAGAGGVSLTLRSARPEEAAVHAGLNPRQQALLREIQPGARIDPGEYSRNFAAMISDRQARTDLSRLMKAGYLRREGKGPSTSYVRTAKR
ncbi:MAG TPA: ATP-binding protein [Thermoanaerobaculia bacterium]|nr:ATP-binding protein [Thermoanaerobaculia bacterium]